MATQPGDAGPGGAIGAPAAGGPARAERAPATLPLLSIDLRYEDDVVLARQRARQVAELLGFDPHDQTRVATAVSELARNAYEYAGGGRVHFLVDGGGAERTAEARQSLVARVSDQGPGIADVAAVLEGRHPTKSGGMGLGLVSARRLADRFRIDSRPGEGTTVEVARTLPRGTPPVSGPAARRIADALAARGSTDALSAMQEQNRELLRTLDDLRARQAEVERLNAELEETNRGVLALYAELDDRAEDLRRASEYKSRFLSDISHEFRTPLTSVLNMTRFLLDRADGPLTPEQERQVRIVRKSIESLADLVNDLLDLAKIEAGHTVLRPTEFTVGELFAALRGMFRPLVGSDAVALVFDEPAGAVVLTTDEQRLSQILRNFISNAIKFTERGEIHVSALPEDDGATIRFAVRDTGIGIAPRDQARIFDDFTQVDSPLQRRTRGTGLGLPLSRRLAALLGGRVELESAPGVGSTFTLVVPRELATPDAAARDHGDHRGHRDRTTVETR